MTRRMIALAAMTAVLVGCTAVPSVQTSPPLPTPTISSGALGPVQPVGTPTVITSDLAAPWSILRLDDGSTLISERDTARVRELTPEGELRTVATIPGVDAEGEGGLLGITTLNTTWLYAYFTTTVDNRIMRFPLQGGPGSYDLGEGEIVLAGLAKASNHDGGRIAFGPDGMLYATVGDAGVPGLAQDPTSLNGKILRMTPGGKIPVDNPFGQSLVYSMGHRNPQGITWDGAGKLWSAEFGQNAWDELNIIEPGGNYGWPIVEGIGGKPGYIDPIAQWPTAEASPSGLVYTRGTFFLAGLGGETLWAIYSTNGAVETVPWFVGEYGRIRDVAAGPDGTLWFITNNTDGRGEPSDGDDRLWQVDLDVFREG